MYEKLNDVTLKGGETVELVLVTGPDRDWLPRIDDDLLVHKGPTWRWAVQQILSDDLGAQGRFYMLLRGGVPFANVMTIERDGVGILGHVFTRPDDRRQGAASRIFEGLMPHFRERGGRAMILGTGYDSPAYHIYKSFGFESIEPLSGIMAYYPDGQSAFEVAHFAGGETVIERLDHVHYPSAPALFVGDYPDGVRSVVMGLFGRGSSEGSMLPLLQDEMARRTDDQPVRTAALVQTETQAVVGVATSGRDPKWPGAHLVDVYCHPAFWDRASALLNAIHLPAADRLVAYCDAGITAKENALTEAGFYHSATLPRWVAKDRAKTAFADVGVWQK